MAARRLAREIVAARRSKEADIVLIPESDDMSRLTAFIRGPPDTPFADCVFELQIAVGSTYPMTPPTVSFRTKIFHPNVHFKTGEICLDILKKEWSPAWDLRSVCRAIITLLAHPEADSPLNCDAGNLLRANDERGFRSMARMYCVEYAQREMPSQQ